MAIEVIMPSLGESVFEGTIASWLKNEGDWVEQYEPILEIETDKVTTEAMAEVAGTLLKILIVEGSTVSVGTVLAYIGDPGEELGELKIVDDLSPAVSSNEADEQMPLIARSPSTSPRPEPATNGPAKVSARPYTGRISPVVGRIAEEHEVDLNQLTGTGRDGRITKKDIVSYIEKRESGLFQSQIQPAPIPRTTTLTREEAPGSTAVPGEILALSSMRQAIAEHMVRSKKTSPHVTTVFDVDFTTVAADRVGKKESFSRDGAKLTFTVYVVAAMVQALKAHPIVNSTWTDNGIFIQKQINIGMATAISDGLIVPVIKNADGLSLLGIAHAVNDLSDRARGNRLQPDEVQDGTFTLTNHGVSGSLFATPIINQPQCGVLGIGKIEKRVKVIEDAIAIRLMAYASLTFDHRILDGATADAFMSTFKKILENWS